MGCDIHLCLERRLRKEKKVIVSPEIKRENGTIRKELSYIMEKKWLSCNITGFYGTWGDRHYGMFAKLADVRNDWNIQPISEPRGIPEDITSEVLAKYMFRVVDNETYEKYYSDGEKQIVSEDMCNNFVEKYDCSIKIVDDCKFVGSPDYHSASWCTTEEMENAIEEILLQENGNYSDDAEEWLALLGAMKGYEMSGEYECRAIFWFDN